MLLWVLLKSLDIFRLQLKFDYIICHPTWRPTIYYERSCY